MTSSETVNKIRDQYESEPYPNIPIDRSPKDDLQALYFHNLATSYYLRDRRVTTSEGKIILDAGCGSGYKALILAEANPGAKIVGIDLSEKSVEVARQRLEHHHIENFEFHVMSLEDLPNLGMEFDYINNDEVLYLLPDPLVGLQAMKSVLKRNGIIRTNFHSAFQRAGYFRAQKFCQFIGLMDGNPDDFEIEILKDTMNALKNGVNLKQTTWSQQTQNNPRVSLMNHLLQGDKGFTIPEVFALLNAAELEFISMLSWRQWDLKELFQTPDDLPAFWAMSLPDLSVEAQLHVFELLHPVHRLLDFWCGRADAEPPSPPATDWSLEEWKTAKAYLHPQLQIAKTREAMQEAMMQFQAFPISRFLLIPGLSDIWLDSALLLCLSPLWDAPQSVLSLAQRWHQLRPIDPANLQPLKFEDALGTVSQMLTTMADFGYVLVEGDSSVPAR